MVANNKEEISVVMAVYKHDNAVWVKEAIDSVLNQTHKADEVIVVIDGPISKALSECLNVYGEKIKQVSVLKNMGLWNALNIGLKEAKHRLVARMDADDIALPRRFEVQVAEFARDKTLSLLGGQIDEFRGKTDNVIGRRIVPENHDEIVKFSKRRSPFNHPTVMYDKNAVLSVGGYRELYRSEDYDLWVRFLEAGYKTKNLHNTILLFRVNDAGIARRKGWRTAYEQVLTRRRLHREGYIGRTDYMVASIAYLIMFLLPVPMAKSLYKKVLRDDRIAKT